MIIYLAPAVMLIGILVYAFAGPKLQTPAIVMFACGLFHTLATLQKTYHLP